MEKSIDHLYELFKALGDKSRLKIIDLLSSSNMLCVGAIAKELNITQPAVSQHLKILKQAGITNAEKVGFYVHYSIDKKMILSLKQEMDLFFAKRKSKPCKKCTED